MLKGIKGKKFKIKNGIPKEYITRSGKKHHGWKGNRAGYVAKHEWVYKRLGKASQCEKCGIKQTPKGKQRWFHWANISGKYKRDINDWWQLCIRCHRKQDNWKEKIAKSYLKSKCWLKRTRNKKGQFIKL